MRRLTTLLTTVALALGVFAAPAFATTAPAKGNVVISQVHGGGGNQGGVWAHDFIELFNRGTAPVSLNGMSVQYTSADGTNPFGVSVSTRTALHGTIQPGQRFLVRGGNGETTGLTALPTPDVDPGANGINLHQNAGRLALVTGTDGLGCNNLDNCKPEQLARIVDLVGYGAKAAFFEGAAPAPGLTNPSAAFRAGGGCTDTDDNRADFTIGAPQPVNSSTTATPCFVPTPVAAAPQAEPAETTTTEPPAPTTDPEPVATPAEQPAPTSTTEEPVTVLQDAVVERAIQPAAADTCTAPILQPVNCDGSSIFKVGSTVPVKFEIPNDGKATFAATRISSKVQGTDAEPDAVGITPTNGVEYRYAGGAYHLNWSTRALAQGTYRITISVDQGAAAPVVHTAILSLRS